MLFQPTNITPSLRGELGNGTVDATKDLTVSWQVNGNSPLTAFQIVIYQNNTSSTQVYTTGKKTDNCPFYGTNYAGAVETFSYTIPKAALSGAGITNGKEYKLVITQWWSSSESVVQTSAAAFLTRAAPSLALKSFPPVLAVRLYTFEANYTQAQGDVLNWVRWQIALQSDVGNPLYDSHNIYGTAELKVSYDGFFSGGAYAVRCRVQTVNGVEADTGWVSFRVNYASSMLEGVVTARCASGQKSAVRVEWPAISYTPGSGTGSWSVSEGILNLSPGSSVTWDTTNGKGLVFPAPWSILYKTALGGVSADLITMTTGGGTLAVRYNAANLTLSITLGGTTLAVWSGLTAKAQLNMVLTPTALYLYKLEYTGGLYPSATLFPGPNLFPMADNFPTVGQQAFSLRYTQGSIASVTLGAVQSCDFIEIIQREPSSAAIQALYNGRPYTPVYDSNTYLLADFSNGLNAGNLGNNSSGELTGLALYRRKGSGGNLKHLADLPLTTVGVYDYGAASQQGPYVYYLFPVGPETYLSAPLQSPPITPCFWNWSILSCVEGTREGEYQVQAEYRFGKNLVSGSMSNNNAPNVMKNFTRYPTIQPEPSNYLSGTLQSLIGIIDYRDGNGYSDTLDLRDEIYELSTTSNTLFLKNRKGDLFPIRLSDATSMETMDASREQAQSVSLSWAQTGSGEGVSLLAYTDIDA